VRRHTIGFGRAYPMWSAQGNGRGMGIAGLVLGAIACMIAFAMLAQVQSAVDNLDRAFPGSDRNVRDTFGPSGQS